MREFKIYQLNVNRAGKTYLTSVFFSKSFNAMEVKRKLITDNFPDNIIVRKY